LDPGGQQRIISFHSKVDRPLIKTHSARRARRASPAALAGLVSLLLAAAADAHVYPLPPPGESVVGENVVVQAREGDTLLDIARRHKVGYEEITLANPDVDTWLPGAGTGVVIPKQFVLPDAPREGIVVNVSEMRLYYYPQSRNNEPARVFTYPISVGRVDWQTPLGKTSVIRKDRDPAWHPPESIREEHAARGDFLPKYVAPGAENPLGRFALRLGLPGYLIHGTNRPYGIGMQVTHGCLRMYPEDIDALFETVAVGTPVRLVDQPAKAGWRAGRLYLEIHPALGAGSAPRTTSLTPLVQAVIDETDDDVSKWVDWEAVYAAARRANGMPTGVTDNMSKKISRNDAPGRAISRAD